MEEIVVYGVMLVGAAGIMIAGARGFHRFYRKLRMYHRITEDYDRVIELRNAGEVDDPESKFHRSDFSGPPPTSEDYYQYDHEVGEKTYPEIIVDFDEGEKKYRGEPKWLKFGRVCFYSGASSIFTTAILIVYLQLLVDFFDSEGVSAFWTALSILTVITVIHVAMRLASYFRLVHSDDVDYAMFNHDIYSFAFSFNMSTFTMAITAFFALSVVGQFDQPSILGFRDILLLLGYAIIISTFLPLLGEIIIRRGNVPDELSETNVRDTEEI